MTTLVEILIMMALLIYPTPDKITVRVTGEKQCYSGIPYTVQEVDFKDYVKGVMVNEFGYQHWTYRFNGSEWVRYQLVPHDEETLRVAAIVIKNYALHQYYTGGKWGGYEKGIVYDCDWDMVYNPDLTHPTTDKAVDDTWDLIVLSENDYEIVPTYFNATYGGCMITHKQNGKCIAAWGWGGIFQKGARGITAEQMIADAYYDTILVSRSEIWNKILYTRLYRVK